MFVNIPKQRVFKLSIQKNLYFHLDKIIVMQKIEIQLFSTICVCLVTSS